MYYDDYWNEPSEFDQQIEEFKDSLRASIKDEIKEKIESLEKELAELKEFKDEKDKFIHKYENEINKIKNEADVVVRDAKNSEKKWKKARLHELLGDCLMVGWRVGHSSEYGEKCDKCDDNRKIHFTSPQGREYTEDCQCAKRHYKYFPKEAVLAKFYVRKKNFFGGNDEKSNFYDRYYTVKEHDDCDCYDFSDDVYPSLTNVDYKTITPYYAVFLNKEDCKKFCDWKNEQELKKVSEEKFEECIAK